MRFQNDNDFLSFKSKFKSSTQFASVFHQAFCPSKLDRNFIGKARRNDVEICIEKTYRNKSPSNLRRLDVLCLLGLQRKLKKLSHFQHFEKVELKFIDETIQLHLTTVKYIKLH